ncbi:MAG: hypothetical protein ABI772_14530, partial [Bacteroidota bacterium]
MKKIFLFIYIVLFSQAAHAIEFVELPVKGSDIVVIKMMFRNGSVCDPKGKEGLTLLTVQTIMDGGTDKMTSSQVKDFTYPFASQYFGSVDKEVTYITFLVHRDLLSKFYEVVKGLMLTPRFDSEDFERVKSNQLNYVDQVIKTSSDEEFSKMALEDFLFQGTNYQSMTSGTVSGIKNITLDDVESQYKKYFTATNLTIGLAGGYDASLKTMLTADMNKLPQTKVEVPAPGKAIKANGLEV